jgi:hypothetical protein
MFLTTVEEMRDGEQLLITYSNKSLPDEIIQWHRWAYPWHHNDTIRSYTQGALREHGNRGKKTDFAYFNRAIKYFGYDQFAAHRRHPNKLMCLWDPSKKGDYFGEHNPCLILIKFTERGKHLDMTAVFRKRDLLKRMIGNCCMLLLWLNNEAEARKMKAGTITDISLDTQYDVKACYDNLQALRKFKVVK